jgi:hypothetical protein
MCFSSYVLEKLTIFVTKCERNSRGTQNVLEKFTIFVTKCEGNSRGTQNVLEKFTIFVTKCETLEEPKTNFFLLLLHIKATNTFLVLTMKKTNGIVPKCVLRN